MNTHRKVQDDLYEFAAGELNAEQRAAVEEHLQSCPACRSALSDLNALLVDFPRPTDDPSAERTEEFWESFSRNVDDALQARRRSEFRRWADAIRDSLQSTLVLHRPRVAFGSLAAGLASLALLFLLTRPSPTLPVATVAPPHTASVAPQMERESESASVALSREESLSPSVAEPSVRIEPVASRLTQYFKKSKVLLIGIANMPDNGGKPIDLSNEQRTSRALVKEARYLGQRKDLDAHTRELIQALNAILIELANTAERNDNAGIEIVRSGMYQQNILFKIRMAESASMAATPRRATAKESTL